MELELAFQGNRRKKAPQQGSRCLLYTLPQMVFHASGSVSNVRWFGPSADVTSAEIVGWPLASTAESPAGEADGRDS